MKIFWSLAFILLVATIGSAQTVVYFPQYVDGSQGGGASWATAIVLTNSAALGTPAASGTLTVTKDNGAALDVAWNDENGIPVGNTFQLAGGQTKLFLSPQFNANGGLAFNSGFVTVTSNLPITGGEIFQEANQNGPFAVAGVPASSALMRQATAAFRFPDPNHPGNTGVAIANPGTTTATITFQLLDKSGATVVPNATRAVIAGNHTAFFISELFPSAPSTVFGTVRITSDQPIATTALFFQGTNTFGTLPIFPLP